MDYEGNMGSKYSLNVDKVSALRSLDPGDQLQGGIHDHLVVVSVLCV